MASIKQRPDGRWRARYRDDAGREHAKHFSTKREGNAWLVEQTASVAQGTHVSPQRARMTLADWCDTWIEGYERNRASTVRQARTHLAVIKADLGHRPIRAVRPSEVQAWVVGLAGRGYADSYVYALHARLSQLFTDAMHDGLVVRSPCSRRTSPRGAKQRPYVATTDQVWALHDALPEHFKPVVLLGAFAGLRVAEIAALRVEDVDFMRGVITPAIQYPNEPLKTDESKNPIPIPTDLAVTLNANPVTWKSKTIVVGAYGRPVAPYTIEAAWRDARTTVEGLPEDFRIHDLRHYFASLLIAAGLDIKTVQARLRHASAKTTLDTYGHLWPDRDESSRTAVAAVLEARKNPPQPGEAETGS
ncbi:tyrosine-type recombinase/integrase [Microbacterium azadirachtae]|uniref:tyrosine-type recombinase/integrase n=1 Tax=Microbacterium azadirachtae TaxID=582680 RepID=UPI00089145A4|nr:site-specific integrase [Microbacterium azadirachtae]SDL30065.1 Site-specific recombinase XerD [Microbacterium azadirachtae]SEF60149.1 Site-specific recombinase XerD [Microbacterium azadirachtae]SEF60772.1 Site-specific recombinase XerD [Microbacterium azadirachtae]